MDLAARADTRHRPILGDRALDHEVGDLAALGHLGHGEGLQIASALTVAAQRDHHGVLGIIDQLAGGARMGFLSTWRLAAGWAERARRRLLERWVRGGRLAGVVAILGQARFQLLDALEQLGNLCRLLHYQDA